jgi:threonine/homoserine/homoserine lactone efflux protein
MWQYTSIVWPFMLFGFIYIVWTNTSAWLSERREKSARRMDSAEITEESPWDDR